LLSLAGMNTQDCPRRLESRPSENAPEEVEVALLFCDVVRSTELTRRLGDRGAYGVIQSFHTLVLRAAAAFCGEELELRGDGVLLAFESPPCAVDCAVEIQGRLLELPQGRRVSVRIGVHTGPVLRIADGYFGSNVILAARVAEEAAPGEILASAALVRRLADRDPGVRAGRWVSLKGIPEPNLVFSLPWRPKRAALAEPPCPSPAHEALLLTLARVRESLPNGDEASCMLGRRNAV
jgi:class 3 adenylate cyclase